MNLDYCKKEGLIKKDPEASSKIEKSLEISKRFLKEAKGNLKMEYYGACELLAYNSSFHSARALLFSKGYRERSHTCLITALFSLFEQDDEICNLLSVFDQLRLSRHNVQYGGALVSKEQAEAAVEFAERFFGLVKKKLGTD